MDLIQQLGPLAFASRLKRISERLMRDGSKIYKELDVEFQTRWFPVMYLLGQKSPLSVTEIARELRMTHPAINQIASGMTKAGLLKSNKDTHDERKRMLSISSKGGRVLKVLVPVWKDFEAATREVIDQASPDFLTALNNIEKALDERDMYHRISDRIKKRHFKVVEIVDYEPRWRKDFERLNVEWLEKYFTVEPYDEAILRDPQRRIIHKGGHILFARLDGKIVGTVAIIHHDDGTFEMAKMAVTETAQGKQVGKRLACECIDWVRSTGADSMILYTNKKLIAANNLYRKLGFVEVDAGQPTKFERLTITMSLEFNKNRDRQMGVCYEKG